MKTNPKRIVLGLLSICLVAGFFTYHASWREAPLPCGDLLRTYAEKPGGLTFVKCERPTNSQSKIRATYKVSGKQSKKVEDFLVEHYGMGALKWTCCGWDNAGKHGGFDHPAFKEIDAYCSAMISMYASGEVESGEKGDVLMETDRDKIDYFTVVVELVVV